MTANHLNQLGLFLGLISGLLLIPEVFRLIPFEYLSDGIDKLLNNLEAKTKFPLRFHPPLWKISFSAEQREKYIEPITAVSGLVFSIIWVATVIFGLVASSVFFLIVGFIPPSYATIRKVIEFRNNVPGARKHNFFVVLVFSFILMIFASPFASLFRVVFLVLRYFVSLVKEYFEKHMALQNLMTIFAVIAFIISNILQLIATYIE